MRLVCAPETFTFPDLDTVLNVVLYGQSNRPERGSAGSSAKHEIFQQRLNVAPRAWDFLSLALSVATADLAEPRDRSPDGWTREFELEIAVADPVFWTTQATSIQQALAFLTTDRWQLRFVGGGMLPKPPREPDYPKEDCVVLLSGGLDSLVGAIDLTCSGKKPFAISQTVRGDAEKQIDFAQRVGGGLRHLQLNHNAHAPGADESSQRARSLIFLAYGILAATTLARYQEREIVPLYVCENGFIAVNPPLTGARIGSLSTRTAHPVYLKGIQQIIDASGLRVQIENPYQLWTKGEMLAGCEDQELLRPNAPISTSCGRFQRFNYKHCGRCVPCQVRRAAFLASGTADTTEYVYVDLGKDDEEHAGFDDIRAVGMAIAEVKAEGLDGWLGTSLNSAVLGDVASLKDLVKRGLDELAGLHQAYGVK
jgi:7-cyano-7-deazaguanine synthase in queuosine biosynthesis